MVNVNSAMKDVSVLTKKIAKDLGTLAKTYQGLSETLKAKFKEEVAYNGSFEGLEVFNSLSVSVSRNLGSVRNIGYLMSRLRDLSSFDVSEIEEEIINGDISKLMKK